MQLGAGARDRIASATDRAGVAVALAALVEASENGSPSPAVTHRGDGGEHREPHQAAHTGQPSSGAEARSADWSPLRRLTYRAGVGLQRLCELGRQLAEVVGGRNDAQGTPRPGEELRERPVAALAGAESGQVREQVDGAEGLGEWFPMRCVCTGRRRGCRRRSSSSVRRSCRGQR